MVVQGLCASTRQIYKQILLIYGQHTRFAKWRKFIPLLGLHTILYTVCNQKAKYRHLPPNHNMLNNIVGTSQLLHQETFVLHLEKEISSLAPVGLTVTEKNKSGVNKKVKRFLLKQNVTIETINHLKWRIYWTFFLTIFTSVERSPVSITCLWIGSPILFIKTSSNCKLKKIHWPHAWRNFMIL